MSAALRLVGFLLLTGWVANLAYPQTGMPDDKDRPSVGKLEPKKLELHKVSNEDLLKQAQLVLDKALAAYLAQLRELATVEIAQEAARKATDTLVLPKDEPPGMEQGDSLEVARKALDRAKVRLDTVKKRLEHLQAEKSLGERAASSIEASGSAALAFANLLDDLIAFVVEIELRVKDRTLPGDAVPKNLERESVKTRKAELVTDQDRWKQKGEGLQKLLEATGKRLDAAKKAVLEADASHKQATRRFSLERKQKSVEKEYAERPVADLNAELASLQEEEAGLVGAFNLALQRFQVSTGKSTQAQADLDALPMPPTRNGKQGGGATSTRALQKYYSLRSAGLEALQTALRATIEQGGQVEAEAAVLAEHFFKTEVVAGVLKRADVKDRIGPRAKQLADLTGGVVAQVEKHKLDHTALAQQVKDARAAGDEASKRLDDLAASQEATQRVAEFEKTLRKMPATEVVAQFTTTAKALDEKLAALDKDRAAFATARATVAELRAKRAALKDPYLRVAEAEAQGEKGKLLAELNKYAGLDRAPRDGTSMGGLMSMPGMEGMTPSLTPEPKKDEKEKGREKESEKLTPLSLHGFQQLLATRVRTIEEQEEKDAATLQAMEVQQKVGTAYGQALGETRQLALKQFALAVDLKKRVGRGELKGADAPEGITAALKRAELTSLDATASALVAVQAETRQEGERLRRADKTLQATNGVLKEALGLASQRLDLLAELKRLERDAQRDKKDLTEAEVKHIEQSATERLAKEDTWLETVVSLDNSAAAKALVEVLQTYYREVVTLEEKQDLLKQRKEKADKLIELTAQEAALLKQAQPLLRDHITALERVREEEILLTRARLKPEEADELLRAYQVKTGKQLPRPVAVPEKDRPAAVQEANAALFERLLDVEAARRWERLLEGRLSPAGIAAETGAYQDQLGTLTAAYGSNVRRLAVLGGKVAPDAAFPGASAVSVESTEIGTARRDLFQVRRGGVLWIAAQIGIVLVCAFLLPRLLTWLLSRNAVGENGTQPQARLVMAFLQAFLKLIVYTIALVIILSILGFDITAILAGLGIGGLALGLAAQHAISDMLGGIIIFLERPFKIGDTVKIGDSEPAQVVGLTWRITQLRDPAGIALNIPNRQVTEAAIVNLTRDGNRTYDRVTVSVPASYPVADVVQWIEEALAACAEIIQGAGTGVDVGTMNVAETGVYYVTYQPFYFVNGLSRRDDARRELMGRIAQVLAAKGVIVEPQAVAG